MVALKGMAFDGMCLAMACSLYNKTRRDSTLFPLLPFRQDRNMDKDGTDCTFLSLCLSLWAVTCICTKRMNRWQVPAA